MDNKKQLTTWEAACIITGYGVGGGVLSMPYLAQKIGFLSAILVLAIAFITSYVLHLMIADLAMKAKDGGQIVACLGQFLFRGKLKDVLTYSFFALMLAILCTNLAGYIAGAEEIIVSIIPIPGIVAKLIFYILAASVVIFGLKAVGVSEKIAMIVIFLIIGILAVASFFVPDKHGVSLFEPNFKGYLAYYGMAMFSLSAFFSVPQAVEGLGGDEKKIRKAIFLGFLNNFILIVVINYCALIASPEVTEVGMAGWSKGIGVWAQLVGGMFTILAMLTTYWSLSLALADIVSETIKTKAKISWIIATLPSLLLAIFNLGGFMEFMRLAGGLISIIIAVMIVPAAHNARKEVPGSILENNGLALEIAVCILYILMGVGSIIPY